jgi:peptidoglycan hydrolase CwlO-like protein
MRMSTIDLLLICSNAFLGYLVYKNQIKMLKNEEKITFEGINQLKIHKTIDEIQRSVVEINNALGKKDIELISAMGTKLKRLEREIVTERGKLASTNGDLKETFEGIYGQINQLQQRLLAITKDDGSLSRYT